MRLTTVTAIFLGLVGAAGLAACRGTQPNGGPPPTPVPYRNHQVLDLYEPPAPRRPTSLVVMIHGCCGDRRDLAALSRALARRGAVVANADVHALRDGGGWPETYLDVVCAYAWARSHARTMGSDAQIAVLGWGDGALVATTVALGWRGLRPLADDCVAATPSKGPDFVIGVGGHYGWIGEPPASLVTPDTVTWFGATPDVRPAAWRLGNPGWWLDQAHLNRSVRFLLLGSSADRTTSRFAEALRSRAFRVHVALHGGLRYELIQPRDRRGADALEQISAALDLE